MTKYIKGKDGKFQGSIGEGKTKTPTTAPNVTPVVDSSTNELDDINNTLSNSVSVYFATKFYPPVPNTFVDPAVEAIQNCAAGDVEKPVKLPEGMSWRGETSAPSYAIVEGHRLENHVNSYRTLVHGDDDDDMGECDECGVPYELGNGTDHCPECGTCWTHCTFGSVHYYEGP